MLDPGSVIRPHLRWGPHHLHQPTRCLVTLAILSFFEVGCGVFISFPSFDRRTKNVVLTTAGGKDLKDNIVNVLGAKQVQSIEPFDFEVTLKQYWSLSLPFSFFLSW